MSENKIVKKRGRKSNAEKKLLLEEAKNNNNVNENINIPKKRGRKPKGGKIIEKK